MFAYIRLARPQDWIKNAFVVLPVPFALAAGAKLEPLVFLLGLAGFCLINSAIYTFNDLRDAAADRLHPRKRRRPIAAGLVAPRAAMIQMIVLLCAGLGFLLVVGRPLVTIYAICYSLINIAYCIGAKHVPLMDVFLLCSGFVIRVLIGCALVDASPSPWLLLCTGTLAMFIGFVKRRADLSGETVAEHRPSLKGYDKAFLDQAVSICASVAMLAYALYCIEVIGALHRGREMASMPFVAYGILNYLRMTHINGTGGSPVAVAYRSLSMQICGVCWLASVTWSLGLWNLGPW
ncbi:MAG: UbiA prenyltransferase family protein [Pirellulales bacterium]|nr:UbiA prenyltransferase family protein [Pirellulales bacterium]